jgi:SAM-dependent methyltransferase
MSEPNTTFGGSIPAAYDRYLGPLLFRPYAAELASRVARLAPTRVLETACGTGILTEELCRVLPPDAELVATDLSEGMLELTRQRCGGDSRVRLQVADAGELPFPDRSFDAVVCQFGIMFVPDKLRALTEANRVLAAGGHHLFNVWDGMDVNPIGRLSQELIVQAYPENTPGFYRVPFGMNDRGQIRDLLLASGLREATLDTVALEGTSPSATDAATGMISGTPTVSALRERGVEDPAPLITALAAALEKLGGRAPLRLPMQAIVVTARGGPRS